MSIETADPNPQNGIKEKETYEQLTDTQAAVVDALAEDDGRSNEEITDDVGCSTTYLYNVKSSFPHIIKEREQTLANERTTHRGNVTVEGKIDLTDEPEPQTLKERPVKSTNGDESEYRIHDFLAEEYLSEETCDRLEAIAEDITPMWLDRTATVEETITALAEWYTLDGEDYDTSIDGNPYR